MTRPRRGSVEDALKRQTEAVRQLKIEAADLEFIQPHELEKAEAMEARLKGILESIKALGAGGLGGAAGGGGGGGLFSIPFEGEFPGGGNRVQAGAAAIAQKAEAVQQKVQAKVHKAQAVFQRRQDEAKASREAAHQQRQQAHQRREEARNRKADKHPMKGDWRNMPVDPVARAQGFWPMIRQQIDKQEHDLRQHPTSRRNPAIRQRRLQALREEAHKLKNELDGGAAGGRASAIGDEFRKILKEVTDIDPDRFL